jgi:hypothetical protein
MNQMISSKHFDLSERPITRSSIALNKRGHVAEIARKGRIVIPMKSLYLHARGEQTSRLITAGLSQPVADGATAKLDHSRVRFHQKGGLQFGGGERWACTKAWYAVHTPACSCQQPWRRTGAGHHRDERKSSRLYGMRSTST